VNIMRNVVKNLSAIVLIGTVAACAPTPVPRPAPIKPPVVIAPALPIMPLPPGGAAASTKLPPYGGDGARITPNRGLSRDEAIWNFRSAINVAALNCQGPVWGAIAQNYNKMIALHKTKLNQSNVVVDNEYRKRFAGQNGLRVRDTHSTELYNFFALPPVREEFCNTALRKSSETLTLPTTAFPEYAVGALGDVDGIFQRFYDAYAQYERDLANWNAKYGTKPTAPPIMSPKT
jgi:hypothetical protein